MELMQVILLLLMMVSAILALNTRDLMVGVGLFCVFSFASAMIYAFMNAVDVGFVEAIIGTVTTLCYIAVFYRMERRSSP